MVCKKCGQKLHNETKICHKCGNFVVKAPVTRPARPARKELSRKPLLVALAVLLAAAAVVVVLILWSGENPQNPTRQDPGRSGELMYEYPGSDCHEG